jgi:hypothetical protein
MMRIRTIIKREKLKTKGNIMKIIQDNIWKVMQKIKKRATRGKRTLISIEMTKEAVKEMTTEMASNRNIKGP